MENGKWKIENGKGGRKPLFLCTTAIPYMRCGPPRAGRPDGWLARQIHLPISLTSPPDSAVSPPKRKIPASSSAPTASISWPTKRLPASACGLVDVWCSSSLPLPTKRSSSARHVSLLSGNGSNNRRKTMFFQDECIPLQTDNHNEKTFI